MRIVLLPAFVLCFLPLASAQTMKTNPVVESVLFNFATATNAVWQIVNDDVMGGVSTSRFRITNGVAVFSGEVSLENNGGFASVRTRPTRFDLPDAFAFVLRVRGDGRRYKFTARMEMALDGPLYQGTFLTKPGEWEEIHLPLRDLVPTFRGRVLTGEPSLSGDKLSSIGFLISDQQDGPFRLEIAWIKVLRRQ